MTRTSRFLLGGLLVALLLAGGVSSFASGSPDGLEAVSAKGCTTDAQGEITGGACVGRGAEEHELADSPFADYALSGVDDAYLSTGLAGILGVLLTFALAVGLFRVARRRPVPAAAHGATADVPIDTTSVTRT